MGTGEGSAARSASPSPGIRWTRSSREAPRRRWWAARPDDRYRHVRKPAWLDLARQVDLAAARAAADCDDGVAKRLVLEEAQTGRQHLKVAGRPTLALPSGQRFGHRGRGSPDLTLDRWRHRRVVPVEPAPCWGEARVDRPRAVLDAAIQVA